MMMLLRSLLVMIILPGSQQLKNPTARLTTKVRYKPGTNDVARIQDLMNLLPPTDQQRAAVASSAESLSRLTTASDFDYCADKVPIHYMLLEDVLLPRVWTFFYISIVYSSMNIALLISLGAWMVYHGRRALSAAPLTPLSFTAG